MKKLVWCTFLACLATAGATAELSSTESCIESAVRIEAILDVPAATPAATLYPCIIWCDGGGPITASASTAAVCGTFARKLCRPENCTWEFNNSVVGLCF
jgi:hypothetical protein